MRGSSSFASHFIFHVPVQVLSTMVGVTAGVDTADEVVATGFAVTAGVAEGVVPGVPVHPAAKTSVHMIPKIRIICEFFIRFPGLLLLPGEKNVLISCSHESRVLKAEIIS